MVKSTPVCRGDRSGYAGGMPFPERFSAALALMGATSPSPMQEACLGEGGSYAVASPTGSGKTLAFLVPALARERAEDKKIRAVVLAPTHDLVMQTVRTARDLCAGTGLRAGAFAGNQAIERQREALKKKPHLAVGNPERIALLARLGKMDLSGCRLLVLDEADALLAKKAGADLAEIRAKMPADAAVRLFSATYTPYAREAAAKLSAELEWLEWGEGAASRVEHRYCAVPPLKLGEALAKMLRRVGHAKKPGELPRALVFAPKGGRVLEVARELEKRGIFPATMDAFTPPETRKAVWADMRSGKARVLVCTDAAMRGIDLPDLDAVFHFKLPFDSRDWSHRAGRAGRWGREGISFAVLEPKEEKTLLRWCAEKGVAAKEETFSS